MGSFALAQFNNLGNTIMLGAVGFWFYEAGSFRWEAFAWFGVLGVMNYSINRWVFYTGMNIVGPSRHITITSNGSASQPHSGRHLPGRRTRPVGYARHGSRRLWHRRRELRALGRKVVPRRHRLVAHEHAHAGRKRLHAQAGNVRT